MRWRLLPIFLACPLTVGFSLDIFVFNPESKSGQTQAARVSLVRFMAAEGIEAQVSVFANAIDFERAVARSKPEYAIVASYYYNAAARDMQWRALLSGHRNGEEAFRKVFMVDQSVGKAADLKNKAVATTSFGAATFSFVNAQFLQPIGLSAAQVRLITVSKDIDGLMALAVGQVKGAIVTQDSIDKLKSINSAALESMKELRRLPAIQHPKVVQFQQAQDTAKLRQAFRRLTLSSEGADFLRYLSITGFQ
jgi:hypothetical protein